MRTASITNEQLGHALSGAIPPGNAVELTGVGEVEVGSGHLNVTGWAAGILFVAFAVLILEHLAGFRAMVDVDIGRNS